MSIHISNGKPRVVIVGGGFGGLYAARRLKKADVEVVLIDRGTSHVFQPLLYQCATGLLSEGRSQVRCDICSRTTRTRTSFWARPSRWTPTPGY